MNLPELLHSPLSHQHKSPAKHVDHNSSVQQSSNYSESSVFERSSTSISVSVSFSEVAIHLSNSGVQPTPVENNVTTDTVSNSMSLAKGAADTILGFIETHMERRIAEGDTVEELTATLDAALKGFEQGYLQAIDELGGLDNLPASVANGIAETDSLVRQGIDELREDILKPVANQLNESVDEEDDVAQHPVNTPAQESVRQSVPQSTDQYSGVRKTSGYSNLQATAASYAESYRRDESIDLQVRTQDGDTITLSFSASSFSDLQAAVGTGQGLTVGALQYYSDFSSSFNLSIRGELDEGEFDALEDLLDEIGQLSHEFFSGDFETAFSMAMDFELDSSEFSMFSLDLALTTKAQITDSYLVDSSSTSSKHNSNNDHGLKQVANILKYLDKLLEKASNFENPRQLLSDLLANHLAQQNLLAQQSIQYASPDTISDPTPDTSGDIKEVTTA